MQATGDVTSYTLTFMEYILERYLPIFHLSYLQQHDFYK